MKNANAVNMSNALTGMTVEIQYVAIGGMSREELDVELHKGIDSLKKGFYSADEVDVILAKEFGI